MIMASFVLTCVIVTLLTWSSCDLYEFSIYCSQLRDLAKRWYDSTSPVRSFIGKGLSCRYCLGHWVAAGWVLLLLFLPTRFTVGLTLFEAVVIVLLAPRIAVLIFENILPPIVTEQCKTTSGETRNGYVVFVDKPDDYGIRHRNMESPICNTPQEAIGCAAEYLMNWVHEGAGTTVEPELMHTVRTRMEEDYARNIHTMEPGKYPELEEDCLDLHVIVATVPLSGELIRYIQNNVPGEPNDPSKL